MLTIFTKNLSDIKFQKLDKLVIPGLNELAICLIHTDAYSVDEVSTLQQLLSAQERDKAARFRFDRDRNSYIITHALLLTILGNYLDSEPAEIEFRLNEFGKPFLAEKHEKIFFNLSHRSGISALAFSTKSEIGIDIEKIDPEFDFDLIADSHFSRAENNFIHEVQGEERKRFYMLWTRKEALLKAVGTGIGENLDVELFRKVNFFDPKTPFLGEMKKECYLYSFEYDQNFIISLTSGYKGHFVCSAIGN